MTPAFIETNSLTKHFDKLQAVENWNWTVPSGSICGLLVGSGFPSADQWLPEILTSIAFSPQAIGNLLRPFATILVVSILALCVAIYKFERTDF